MNYNGYGSLAGLTEYSQHSAPSYLENSYGAAYGDYGASRDVSGRGGYTYRQYDDGRIKILSGASGVGKTFSSGGPWRAITDEIGPYPSSGSVSITSSPTYTVEKKGWGDDDDDDDDEPKWFEGIGDTFVDAFRSVRTPQLVPQQTIPLQAPGSAKKAVPWGWIIGGTLGVGAIIAISVAVSKRGKK